MLHILGAGFAYPETLLTNDLLVEVARSHGNVNLEASKIEREFHICSRYTSLPVDYLRTTGNKNPMAAEMAATVTPTQLAREAVDMALVRAGISKDQIGLIIAAVSTPLQTTPSEAQRLGGLLGLKIPAYDICGAAADLALHVHSISKWKPERIPEVVLCVSTNLPTQRVNYGAAGVESMLFGDGAAAILLSGRKTGAFMVRDSFFETEPKQNTEVTFDLFFHAQFNPRFLTDWIAPKMDQLLGTALTKNKLSPEQVIFIGSQLVNSNGLAGKHGILPEGEWYNRDRCGYSLGSSPMTAFAERWEDIPREKNVVVCFGGPGASSGYLVLKRA